MKKLLASALFLLFFSIGVTISLGSLSIIQSGMSTGSGLFPVVSAQNSAPAPKDSAPPTKLDNPIKSESLEQFMKDILSVVVRIGFIVALFFLIYSGFLYVTAQGNEEKLKTAHSALLWTVVGSAVLLGAQVLVSVIEATINNLRV